MTWSQLGYVFYTGLLYLTAGGVALRLWRHPERPLGIRGDELTRTSAAWIAAGSYLVLFGWGIATAIHYLLQQPTYHLHVTRAAVIGDLVLHALPTIAATALLTIAILRTIGGEAGDVGLQLRPRTRYPLRLFMQITLAATVSAWLGFSLYVVPGLHTDPWTDPNITGTHPWAVLGTVAQAASAALSEELIVVAVPVLLLTRAKMSTRTVVVALIAARLAYHVYYGPAVLGMALWAGAVLWLYLRYRLLWPLIVEHFLFDLHAGLVTAGYTAAGIGLIAAQLAVPALVIAGSAARHYLRGRRRLTALATADRLEQWQHIFNEYARRRDVPITTSLGQRTPTRLHTTRTGHHVTLGREFAGLNLPHFREGMHYEE